MNTTPPPPRPVRSAKQIELRGVRVHNLKQVDLDLPLGQLVVLTGVSGSGKSSLAFDTVFAEGQRRYIESFSASARQYLERIERPDADRVAHVPPAIAIRSDPSIRSSDTHTTVASLVEVDTSLRRLFARIGCVRCPGCGCDVRPQSSGDIATIANRLAPATRWQLCISPGGDDWRTWLARGFTRAIVGGRSFAIEELSSREATGHTWIVVDRLSAGKSTFERVVESAETAFREGNGRCTMLVEVQEASAPTNLPTMHIDGRVQSVSHFSRYWECSRCQREFLPPEPRLFEPGFGGGCPACRDLAATEVCTTCHGTRLCPDALSVHIADRNLADMLRRTVAEALAECTAISNELAVPEQQRSRLLWDDVLLRLGYAADLGLGHLTLLRSASTLSGGQIRRLLLASALGSRLTGTLCVIDEPSSGLHPTEMPLVIDALRKLLDRHNSLIVIDHAADVIRAADHVIGLGPGAGPRGGEVIFAGAPEEQSAANQNLAGAAGAGTIAATSPQPDSIRHSRRPATDWLTLSGITYRNLRDMTVRIPLGALCVVSGPGGSGKTSLVTGVLVPALRERLTPGSDPAVHDRCAAIEGGDDLVEVAVVDRAPLTRSSRSNAATWIDVFDDIRDVFAQSIEARQRGFGPQHFSFNASQGGRCRACRGTGVLRHQMYFLPDVTLTCPECGGTRYRREILDVKYRGRSIADVLAMSAAEAAVFFRNHPRLPSRLQLLKQIGLDYLVLGQPTDTLSGGEAQRLKLAARLTTSRGPTMIVCDEATVGLHPSDVERLIGCFDELLAIGHSIVVIDNSPELCRAADLVIELDGKAQI